LKLWAARFLSLALSGAAGLLALELGIRQFLPYYDPRNQIIYRPNDEGMRMGVPSTTSRHGTPKGDFFITLSFNRYGLRDAKDFAQATTNDIFVLGDSQSLGWGVEETNRFSSLLEKKLARPVFNIAMVDNDLRGYQRLLDFVQRHGGHVRNLVIGVCMENDLLDYSKVSASQPAAPPKPARESLKRRLALWAQQHSALWICSSYTLEKHELFRRLFERIGLARNVEQITGINQYDSAVLAASRDELLKLARPFNSVVLIIPSRGLWYGHNIANEEKVHTGFVQMLREAGLRVVDMKPVLEQAGDPLHFYYKHDPHWTAEAHAAAAAALLQSLRAAPEWQFLSSP
jgi:hypothetical protein